MTICEQTYLFQTMYIRNAPGAPLITSAGTASRVGVETISALDCSEVSAGNFASELAKREEATRDLARALFGACWQILSKDMVVVV